MRTPVMGWGRTCLWGRRPREGGEARWLDL